MPFLRNIDLVVLSAFFATIGSSVAADPPPTSAVVGQTATELWKTKKLAELERYLTALEKKYPKRACAIIGRAFLETYYRGDLQKASDILNQVIKSTIAHKIPVSEKFGPPLSYYTFAFAEEAARLVQLGQAEEFKQNADPNREHERAGSRVPELLVILSHAPDVDLPLP
jgi:hypothetical protein